ncbi:hypothetical protein [Clostridium thailandense]|uniref:hypothetical protein n=1 Tax=Clostridium thailandense TaxID=2794346 RepID=UPI003988E8DC
MEDYLKIIKEFNGIIGAVVGSTTTLVITKLLKSTGKVCLYLKEWEVENTEENEIGEINYIKTTSLEVDSLYIKLTMDIYNSSEIPKIMRNIKIGFYNNKKELFSIVPNDKDNEFKGQQFNFPQKSTIINLESKKCIIKKFSFNISDKNVIDLLKNANVIYFMYTNENNKNKKFPMRKNIINE